MKTIPRLERLLALPALAPLRAASPDLPAVHLVGGGVRDLLLGRPVRDLDLAVEGEIEPVVGLLAGVPGEPDAGRLLRRHDRFGTATVTRGGAVIDIARTRRERYPSPGALPEVEPAPLSEDLLRRDFTVNAVALGLVGPAAGKLLGVPGALEDLRAGRLRVLHRDSFRDDPTRLLRLARYRARLGFEIEPETRALVAEAIADPAEVWRAGGERLGAELSLLAGEEDPSAALVAAEELGLLGVLDPLLVAPAARELTRAFDLLPAGSDRVALVLAATLRAAERPGELAAKLGLDARSRALATGAPGLPDVRRRVEASSRASELDEVLSGLPVELVALAGAEGADGAARYLREIRDARLEIRGEDLLRAGTAAGPAVGDGLRAARRALLDGRAPDAESQLRVALDVASRNRSP